MWTRVKESDLVSRLHMRPTRVVLDRDASTKEYRTYLETFHKDGMITFCYGLIFVDESKGQEDFELRQKRL